jgi:hypothetical protein
MKYLTFRTRFLYTAIILFISVASFAGAQEQSTQPVIESISIFNAEGEPEQIIFKLNGSHRPKTFRLDGERPRLIFDFFNTRYTQKNHQISGAGGEIIAGVRVGRHNDPQKTRVVVDINQQVRYQADQIFNVSNNSLVITFLPDSSADQKKDSSGPRYLKSDIVKVKHQLKQEEAVAATDQPSAPEKPQAEDQKTVGEETVPISADQKKRVVETKPDITPADPDESQDEQRTDTVDSKPDITPVEPANPQDEQRTDTVDAIPPVTDEISADAETTEEIEQQEGSVLLDVSFEQSINNSETVLFRLNNFHPPLVFGIEKGEPRVVCDFLDTGIDPNVPEEIETSGAYIERVRISNHSDPNKIRVVLELVANKHYDLQQLFFKDDNLFVIIVKELQE